MSEEPSSIRSSLPIELLRLIFSHLESSESSQDLYHVLLASRHFCTIAKPILYRHIFISTEERYKLLQQIREEDKKLVRHVTILGEGPMDLEELRSIEDCEMGSVCVWGLLTGFLLDISVIETLHIRDVREDIEAAYPFDAWYTTSPKIASKLSELSIWDHQGGDRIWEAYLTKRNLPQLRRLGYSHVTRYETAVSQLDPDHEDYEYIRDEYRFEYPFLEEVGEGLGKGFPLSTLKVLVADCPTQVSTIPKSLQPRFLSLSVETPSGLVQLNDSFTHLRLPGFTSKDTWFANAVASETKRRSKDASLNLFLTEKAAHNSTFLDKLQRENVIVRAVPEEEEEENATSLIFPSFIKYLEESGQLGNGGK
ncbi:uncharacterized protein JCM6883_000773 [Sporobolomyces salmoneus]|uniref:uncharacterized protein n=1 Tax=Sporobolomyces salmoneus TaxID=183962 RepID=UPI00316C44E2